jgi:radical S-adenosyl methionine domain-containing protein 2
VNFHLLRACNANCRFCFATFRDVQGQLTCSEAQELLERLAEAGCEKLNFAGGEPTLSPHLPVLLRRAKALGMTTSLVTNGFRLARLLKTHADALDWVGLSVDAADERTQAVLGRGVGDHVATAISLAQQCREAGVRVKLNTVVTALTWQNELSALVRAVAPERWKVFQVLPVAGQNDGIEDLLITREQFQAFLDRHAHLAAEGTPPVAEDNRLMRGSYVMVDPQGRFFDSTAGRHTYSEPILEVGVAVALGQINFSSEKFTDRGGRYEW